MESVHWRNGVGCFWWCRAKVTGRLVNIGNLSVYFVLSDTWLVGFVKCLLLSGKMVILVLYFGSVACETVTLSTASKDQLLLNEMTRCFTLLTRQRSRIGLCWSGNGLWMILLSDSRESFALVPDATFPGFVRRRLFVATGVENIQASAFRAVFYGVFLQPCWYASVIICFLVGVRLSKLIDILPGTPVSMSSSAWICNSVIITV
jgi:hypothetical protein